MENRIIYEIVDLMEKVDLRSSVEDFFEQLIWVLTQLLPDFEAGSAALISGDSWKYVAWKGFDEEIMRKIKLEPDKDVVPPFEEPIVIDNIFHQSVGMIDEETEELYRKVGSERIKKTIAVGLFSGKEQIGAIYVDSFKDVEVNEEDLKVVKLFGKIASLFAALKLYHEKERSFRKGVIGATLKMMEMRDPYTTGHSENVAKYSVEIAKELRLEREDIDTIYWGAIAHDIGKIAIPEAILNKPGKLTDEEYEIVKLHPVRGEEAMMGFEWLDNARKIVRHHHERWDGTGYPDGLKGEDIPLEARVVSIADAFDSMVHKRIYRPALELEEALREIEVNAGTQFDPYIARRSLKVLEKVFREVE